MSQRVFAVLKCWSFCGSGTCQAPFLMCLCVLTGFLQRPLWSKGFRERNKRTPTCMRTYFTPAWLSVNKVSSCPLRGKWQHDKRVEGWRQGEERGGRWGCGEYWEGRSDAILKQCPHLREDCVLVNVKHEWTTQADHPESSKNSNSGGWLSVTTCLPAGFNAAQLKPNKLQSLRERHHMEKVIKLDLCFSRPPFPFCATYKRSPCLK